MPIPCARCSQPLPDAVIAAGGPEPCGFCGAENQVRVFPAALRPATPVHLEAALDGEAACFDHPGKRAVAACRHCGRFVCQLCSVEFGEEIWCPSCVMARAGSAREANLETSRTLYDSIAVSVPLMSLVIWPFTVITGPGAVVYSMVKWRAPLSLVRRYRWRFVAAILIGLSEVAGWLLVIVYALTRARAGGG
jgi:hypothetical protein